jgi:predicted RNA-binding protein with PIN domain
MGLLRGKVGPAGLRKARLGLLGFLRAVYGEEAKAVTVVFDAAHAPPGIPREEECQGIHVCFAEKPDEADDLIERLIRHDSAPRQLTIVSDDHRIQRAARRRRCTVSGCSQYLQWLERRRRQSSRKARQADPKPGALSEAETAYWMREFASLQNDPHLQELSDPLEFLEDVD